MSPPKNTPHRTAVMLTFKHWADPPNSQAPQAGKLTKGQFEEEEGDATEHQHDEVWQHEGTWGQQESFSNRMKGYGNAHERSSGGYDKNI